MTAIIELTLAEVAAAATVGVNRHLAAIKRNLPDKHGFDGADGWTVHIEGACGEQAFCKACGIFWSASINTFKDADVGRSLQIRSRSKHDYDLIVRESDDPEQIYVLVTGKSPKFIVRGWIKGADARRDEWLQNHGNRPPAWFVPQSALSEDFSEILGVGQS